MIEGIVPLWRRVHRGCLLAAMVAITAIAPIVVTGGAPEASPRGGFSTAAQCGSANACTRSINTGNGYYGGLQNA